MSFTHGKKLEVLLLPCYCHRSQKHRQHKRQVFTKIIPQHVCMKPLYQLCDTTSKTTAVLLPVSWQSSLGQSHSICLEPRCFYQCRLECQNHLHQLHSHPTLPQSCIMKKLHTQGHIQDFSSGGWGWKFEGGTHQAWTAKDRGLKGRQREWGSWGGGSQSPLHQLGDLGERGKLHSGVRGIAPADKAFLAFYGCQMAFRGMSKGSSHAPASHQLFHSM